MLNGLDLFSGIGGISIALAPWVRPIAYCESDRYAQSVLLSRMAKSDLPCAPIWDDVRTLRAGMLPGPPDVIYGGFPCQDLSVAGDGAGLAGERSGLVFDMLRLIGECRPSFAFLENVPALTVRGLDRVLLELHALGYDARWTIVSAAEVGAPHIRERVWILAHANGQRGRDEQQWDARRCDGVRDERSAFAGLHGKTQPLADANCPGRGEQRWPVPARQEHSPAQRSSWWAAEPDVGRVVNGLPLRVDRIRGLGNAVVPAAAREAFCRLIGSNIEDLSVYK